MNAVFTISAEEATRSEGTFPLQPFLTYHLLIRPLHVHFLIFRTYLTKAIVLSDGVSFETRLLFSSRTSSSALSSWFKGIGFPEAGDQKQVLHPLSRTQGKLLLSKVTDKLLGPPADRGSRTFHPDQDLTALIRPDPVDQTGIYTNAIQLLSSLQGSPSCNRIATSTLLDSCHSLDGTKKNAEDSLESVRSVYAAQLAICEIVSAGSTVPQTCKSLDTSSETNIHQIRGSNTIRREQLGLCLQSLESKPQWWTSYSNSKQNAMVMCQAARVDIEKGRRPTSATEFL